VSVDKFQYGTGLPCIRKYFKYPFTYSQTCSKTPPYNSFKKKSQRAAFCPPLSYWYQYYFDSECRIFLTVKHYGLKIRVRIWLSAF